jgi:steroid delta-isomerase-like uncharacterized protein
MSVQEHQTTVRRWIEAWNTQDLDAVEDLVVAEFVRHDANLPEVVGPAAQRDFMLGVFGAFPDIQFELQQFIAQGDLAVAHMRVRGTHRGEFLGISATGRTIAIQSVETFRLADGKVAEQWVLMDALGLLQQLGAVASPG